MNIHTTRKGAKLFAKENDLINVVRRVRTGSDVGKYITFTTWELYDYALEIGMICK